jgi:hypothetical protein
MEIHSSHRKQKIINQIHSMSVSNRVLIRSLTQKFEKQSTENPFVHAAITILDIIHRPVFY